MNNLNNLYRLSNPVLTDALDRIMVKILQQKDSLGAKVFLLCGCEPGAGATTLVINIAIALAVSRWRVVFVDADLRKDPQFKRLSGEKGLMDYLDGNAKLTDIIHTTGDDPLHYIPCGAVSQNQVQQLCSAQMSELMVALKERYDFVLVDSPALGASMDAEILTKYADATILVAQCDHTEKRRAKESCRAIESAGGHLAGIVINRMNMAQYGEYNKNYSYFIDKEYETALRKKMGKQEVTP